MRTLQALAVILALTLTAAAQKSDSTQQQPAAQAQAQPQVPLMTPAELASKVPPAKAEDVRSYDAIMHAIYDVISGPVGTRDWNRLRSLCLPDARFTTVGKRKDGSPFVVAWSVEDYIREAGVIFTHESFYENAIVNQADSFGGMTQVFSSYESRHNPGEKPFQRGINSFQLVNDGTRWWVVSIAWAAETPDTQLPAKMATKQ
jgi:hypothetical protein